jgi:hypothetical protein
MWVIATSIFWASLGVLLIKSKFVPLNLPKVLGRSLYWVGVPLQILALARRSDFSQAIWLPPLTTVQVLLLGLVLAGLSLYYLKRFTYAVLNTEVWDKVWLDKIWPKNRSGQGSFVLASILGNTGFVGLAIVPAFVSKTYLGWVVLYGITHNLLGSYGLGVFLASYFGRPQQGSNWWMSLRDLLSVPSLWAFAIGWCSRYVELPGLIDSGIQTGVLFVIPGAFLLIGMQLCQLQGIKSLQSALVPTTLKMLVLPGLAGLGLSLFGLSRDARLTLVLMSGMPTAFANIILAEEYDLDRQVAASSILVSTVILPLMIPFWLALFG